MSIAELSVVSDFPLWGYFALVIGSLIIMPIIVFIVMASGGGRPEESPVVATVIVIFVTLATAIISPLIVPSMMANVDKYENFSQKLQSDYGLTAPEKGHSLMNEKIKKGQFVSFEAIIEGNEFIATTDNGKKVFIVVKRQGDHLDITEDGRVLEANTSSNK